MHFPQLGPQGEEFHQLELQAEEHALVEECRQPELPIEGFALEEELVHPELQLEGFAQEEEELGQPDPQVEDFSQGSEFHQLEDFFFVLPQLAW